MAVPVSIVVSVYNKQDTVARCVESLINQDYPDKKIIVIDNYSTDQSFERIVCYKSAITLVRIRGTYARVLNAALDLADTAYLALTDADCVAASNWLTELMKGFDEQDIVATAGYCGTPKEGLNSFQNAIGLELESRFKSFPRYIRRAPTMNLCFKVDIARRVKFDERMEYVVEPDFGYRLTGYGKMKYLPDAKIRHYHRSTVLSYFRQQRSQAAGAVRTYLLHPREVAGDHISTLDMLVQVPLFYLIAGTVIMFFIIKIPVILPLSLVGILIILYLYRIFKTTREFKHYYWLMLIFLIRTISWSIGLCVGLYKIFSSKRVEKSNGI